MLFALDLIHVSNGLTDVDGNQLTTPEFTVTDAGKLLKLNIKLERQFQDTFQLNVYILNDLYHRLPDRLRAYNRIVFEQMRGTRLIKVCCCYRHLYTIFILFCVF